MGYASVVWLHEGPVRAALAAGTARQDVAADLGAAVLDLADGRYGGAGAQVSTVRDCGAEVGRVGTFHSTEVALLHWDGRQLQRAPSERLAELAAVDRAVPDGAFVPALGPRQQLELYGRPRPGRRPVPAVSPLAEGGQVSVWWVHHDAVVPGTSAQELGEGMLGLLFTDLGDSAPVGRHGNGLGKLGTVLDAGTPFACAWWGTAAYRLVRLLDSGEDWTARFPWTADLSV